MTAKVKNPNRVAAGKLNRLKRKPLSAQAIDRLRSSISERKPWTRSTGPRTADGKRKVSGNSRKPESQPPEWLHLAMQVQRNISKLSRGCHIDPAKLELVESRSVAEDLRATIPFSNQQFARGLSARLLEGTSD